MIKIIVFALVFFIFNPLSAATVKVINVMGRAECRKKSETKWQKVTLNKKLSDDHRVRVGRFSMVELLCENGSKITLRNQAVFDINELKTTVNNNSFSFRILYGKVKAAVNKLKRKNDAFVIHTPTAVVGVRGTILGISVRSGKKSKIAVFEGEVEVKNIKIMDQAPIIVKASEMTIVVIDKPAEKARPIDKKNFEEWATKLEDDERYLKDGFIKW